MRSNYKKLGDYIREVNVKNSDNNINYLLGVSNDKYFMPSIANINGTDLSKYKVIKTRQFAFGPVTSRNGDKISIALMESDEAIVSTSYTVFEVIDHDILLPEYLILWFKRTDFDRYCRFMSHGSVREIFDWNMMCQVRLPVPSIQLQKAIVSTLKTIDHNIEKSKSIIDKLRDFSRMMYSDIFKKYTYNNSNGKIYENKDGEVILLKEEDLPIDWKIVSLEDIANQIKSPIKAGKDIYEKRYVPIDLIPNTKLVIDDYLSGRNAKSSLISFNKGDILLGAMRVYFHRVSFASFDGITRSTAFVLRPIKESDLATVLLTLDDDETIAFATKNSRGTTMPYTVWKDGLGNFKLVLPPEHVRKKFNESISTILRYTTFQVNKLNKLEQIKKEINKNLSALQWELRWVHDYF